MFSSQANVIKTVLDDSGDIVQKYQPHDTSSLDDKNGNDTFSRLLASRGLVCIWREVRGGGPEDTLDVMHVDQCSSSMRLPILV